MGWERRRNGRMYYFRAERDGDRVRKVYVGGGERGRQAAAADQAARHSRAQAAELRQLDRRPVDELAAKLHDLGATIDRLLACRLLCDGWKQHHREWRRPRHDRGRDQRRG